MSLLIVIPARYGSTRLPGKPLREIAGVPMLLRTMRNAERAANKVRNSGLDVVVTIATDDARIEEFCVSNALPVTMTSKDLATGSDRARAAADQLDTGGRAITHVLNLQGDAPFTPPEHMGAVINTLIQSEADAATPYVQLDWNALDALREHKKSAPFSGTSLIENNEGRAIWFSKTIIPAIRGEAALRKTADLSPIKRHIGLYAYRRDALINFSETPPSPYETLEGLEQLRLLEAGRSIACVGVAPPRISIGGIDTQADIDLAEQLIAELGDPYHLANST